MGMKWRYRTDFSSSCRFAAHAVTKILIKKEISCSSKNSSSVYEFILTSDIQQKEARSQSRVSYHIHTRGLQCMAYKTINASLWQLEWYLCWPICPDPDRWSRSLTAYLSKSWWDTISKKKLLFRSYNKLVS